MEAIAGVVREPQPMSNFRCQKAISEGIGVDEFLLMHQVWKLRGKGVNQNNCVIYLCPFY